MNDELEDILADDEDTDEPSRNRQAAERRLDQEKKRLERELKKATERIAHLEPFEQQVKLSGLKEAFSKAGLSDKHAELFKAVRGDADPTDDLIRSFAEEYELPIKSAEPPEVETAEPAAPVFPPPVQGAGPGFPEGVFTPEQAAALFASDPDRYARMRQSGQLKLDKLGDHKFFGQQPE